MLAYLFGLIAVGLYNYKAFKTLAGAKSYRELALVMTAVSIAFFNVGMWLACVPELSTNTNLATTFLLASAGFQCSMTLMERAAIILMIGVLTKSGSSRASCS